MNETEIETALSKYHHAVAHQDATRRAAREKKEGGGSGSELWPLNLAALEAEQACVELGAEIINRVYDPALECLRVLLIDELEKASRELAGPLTAPSVALLSEPTPGGVLGRVDALLVVETERRRRDAICARLRLLFLVAEEASTLIGAERRALRLPSPPRLFDLSPVGAPPSPSTSVQCAALVQHIDARRSAVIDQKRGELRAGISELRARIRDYLAEQKRKDDDDVKARTQLAARKADEEQARRQSLAATLAKYAAQDAEAAKAARQAPLTAEEHAAVAAGSP